MGNLLLFSLFFFDRTQTNNKSKADPFIIKEPFQEEKQIFLKSEILETLSLFKQRKYWNVFPQFMWTGASLAFYSSSLLDILIPDEAE